MILIVDDQKDIGTGLERLLRYAGHESVSVTGGAEALALLHVRKPSLLILDVNMPEMDGLTILRMIKEHDELKDVWVAAGGCPPAAPAVPYVRPLTHTVPHLMGLLAVGKLNGSPMLGARGTCPAAD